MGQPKTVSKAMFQCVALSLFLVCALAEYPLAVVAARELGPRSGIWICGLASLSLSSSWLLAMGIFKLLGMSRSGKTLEIRGHASVIPEGDRDGDEVVEVHNSKGINLWHWVVISLCLVFCLAILRILVLMPHAKMKNVEYAYVLIAFFGSGALFLWWVKDWASVRADASGLYGYPLGFHFRRKFVPWSAVATCEIHTVYDTFGAPTLILPVLKDRYGRELMTPNLLHTRFEDQERLARYIRVKLAKAMDDFLE
jgi:hypothetical protein